MSQEIHQQVTDRILNALAEGRVPWQRPWLGHKNDGPPTNALSSLPFWGVNILLLNLAGFRSKWWATQKVWNVFGFQVKPRQEGTQVIYGEVDSLSSQTVFNAEQIEGPRIERYLVTESGQRRLPAFEAADRVIAATGADIRHEPRTGALYYRLPKDYIVVPLKEQFEAGPYGVPPYYITVFHELTHATEHRLHWLADPLRSIKERYWIGEMRAVFGASFLAAEIGIPDLVKERERYLPKWSELMKADNTLLFRVASAASDAAEFILSFAQRQMRTA
jgi:antirestriction protein ArdC